MKNGDGADMSALRHHNSRNLLEAIYEAKRISKTGLASLLGLSKAAVGDNLALLCDMGLVTEAGEGMPSTAGGRKPQYLKVSENLRYTVAIDLNYRDPLFALCSLSGDIIDERTVRVTDDMSAQQCAALLEDTTSSLLASHSLTVDDLTCIALSSPGAFSADGKLIGVNRDYTGPNWTALPLSSMLGVRTGARVLIKNDINCAALGESVHSHSGHDDLLYICCGIGLGAGIILGGRLYEGYLGNAGQIYAAALPGGGTFEKQVGANALVKAVRAAVDSGGMAPISDGEPCFEDIVKAYGAGTVIEPLERICSLIAAMAQNYALLLGIRHVVFGGEYSAFYDSLERAFYSVSPMGTGVRCELSAFGRHAAVYGLSELARRDYFDRVCGLVS